MRLINILHLEDDPADSRLIGDILRFEGIDAKIRAVSDRPGFMAALAELDLFDLVLADYRLPAFDGAEALKIVRERDPDLPFIFVTGALGEERAVETLKNGATDFVLKDRMDRLGFCIRRALAESEEKAMLANAQQALLESESRLRLALEGGKMGLWELDLKNGSSVWNAHQSQLLGRPADKGSLDSDEFYGYLYPEDGRKLRSLLGQTAKSGSDLDAEFRIIREDNRQLRWMACKGRLFRGANGDPGRIVGVTYDVTRRKEDEDALREAGRRKDEFLAMLAHELRNPLGSIRNANHVAMLRANGDPTLLRTLEIVDRQVAHMARLLDDLLDVARVSQGKITLIKEPLDIRTIVRHACDAANETGREGRPPIGCQIPDAPVWVEGDAVRLEQVIGNLLSNAQKFCEEGAIRVSVFAKQAGHEPFALIQVEDTGIGIEPEALPRVFDLFMQADQSLARSRGGLGIGLSMVKRLVEMHGGAVFAHSEGSGKGSLFSVRLPLIQQPALPADANETAGGAGAGFDVASKLLRVLIVDDNADGAYLLGEIARSWGCDVKIAAGGLEGIEQAVEWIPQIILLDIGMPGMDGFEVVRRLRAESRLRGAKIFAMTGYSDASMRNAASANGFDDYLVKPIDTAELEELLQACLLSR